LTIVLEDKNIIELMRILMDSDAESALWNSCGSISRARRAICSKAAER
jgi:hypothetical protein